jgi:hypothetical protein
MNVFTLYIQKLKKLRPLAYFNGSGALPWAGMIDAVGVEMAMKVAIWSRINKEGRAPLRRPAFVQEVSLAAA